MSKEMKPNKPDKREVISDCLMVAGGVLLSVGAGVVNAAAGLIVAGLVAICFGILVAAGGDNK